MIGFRVGILSEDFLLTPGLDSAVDHIEVELSVKIVVMEAHAETCVFQTGGVHSRGVRLVSEASSAVHIEGVGFTAKVRHEQVQIPVLVYIHPLYAHASFRRSVSIDRASQQESLVDVLASSLVVPEVVGCGIVGHIDVNIAVLIVVRWRNSKAVAKCSVQTGGCRPVLKVCASHDEQGIRAGGVVVVRAAVVPFGEIVEAGGFGGSMPEQVVDHKQVQIPVAVSIQESRAGCPTHIFRA